MDRLSEWIKLILAVLPLLSPTAEGRRRRQRNRRYKEIKRLTRKRDNGKITKAQYDEAITEIERKYN